MSFIYHRKAWIHTQSIPDVKGVFSSLLVVDGKALFLKEHIQRIKKHCQIANINFSGIEIQILQKLIRINQADKGRYRLRLIIERQGVTACLSKEPMNKKQIALCLYPTHLENTDHNLKIWPYKRELPLLYAKSQEVEDCIILDPLGAILETGIANLFWVRENTFFYPDPCLPYFQGITLNQAIAIAKELKLEVKKGRFFLKDLNRSTLFYCNAIKGILPVKKLEGQKLFLDPILIDTYLQMYQKKADLRSVGLLD